MISPNVNHFVVLKGEWGLGVGLTKRRGHHPEPHSRPEISKLLELYREEELHLFRHGRSYKDSQQHVNTYAEGIKNLQKKKLKKFILDSTRPRINAGPIPQRLATVGGEPPVSSRSGQTLSGGHDGGSDDESSGDESAPEHESGEEDEDTTGLTRGRVDLVDGQLLIDFDGADGGETTGSDADGQQDGDSSADELANEEPEDVSDDLDSGDESSD